jgi:hypothetical protein
MNSRSGPIIMLRFHLSIVFIIIALVNVTSSRSLPLLNNRPSALSSSSSRGVPPVPWISRSRPNHTCYRGQEEPSLSERVALISLYNATDGNNWVDNHRWLSTTITPCMWSHICCMYVTRMNFSSLHIVELNLGKHLHEIIM